MSFLGKAVFDRTCLDIKHHRERLYKPGVFWGTKFYIMVDIATMKFVRIERLARSPPGVVREK